MTLITDLTLPRKNAKAFEAAQGWLQGFKKELGIHYAKVETSGKVNPFINQACHSAMGYNPDNKNFAYVATPFVMTKEKKALCQPFIHWLHHESPLARFIVNTGTDTEKLGTVVPMNLYRGIVQSICILSRHPYEVAAKFFEKWNEAVSEGRDPFLMVMVLFNTTWDPSAPTYYFLGSNRGHRTWGLGVQKEATLNALRGTLAPVKGSEELKLTMKDNPSVYGGMDLFGSQDTRKESQVHYNANPQGRWPGVLLDTPEAWDALFKHREKVLDIKKPKEEGYRPPNPWNVQRGYSQNPLTKDNYREKTIRNSEVMSFVVPYLSSLPEIQQAIKERCY